MEQFYVEPNIKRTQRVFPRQNRYAYHRYDMNENPAGLPRWFVKKVTRKITPEFLAIYPEPDRFLHRYADYVGAKYENLLATNGSDMAIRYILETFGERGKKVVTVAPSFEMYRINCNILGLQHYPVNYNDDLSLDFQQLLAAIDNDTRVVVLVNPNNPVGNVYRREQVEQVINRARQYRAIVVIDEAYYYFYNQTFIDYALHGDNVIVLRTFSKLFSLAACRLGVVISNPTIIQYLKNGKLTFDANAVALLFAENIIACPRLITQLIAKQQAGKEYLLTTLRALGYDCRDGQGNYVFIATRRDAHQVTQALADQKHVLVHDYGNPLLSKLIRVSTGDRKSMKFFVKAFLAIDR